VDVNCRNDNCHCNCSQACECGGPVPDMCSGNCNCDCFPGDVLITLKNGKKIPIKDLKPTDILKTYNGYSRIELILRNIMNKEIYKIEFTNGEFLRITGEHLVVLSTGEFKSIDPVKQQEVVDIIKFPKLRIGDVLMNKKIVRDIVKLEESEPVYDIVLKDDFTYYADDVLCAGCCSKWIYGTYGYLAKLNGLKTEEFPSDLIDDFECIHFMLGKDNPVFLETITKFIDYCSNYSLINRSSKKMKAILFYDKILEKMSKVTSKEKLGKYLKNWINMVYTNTVTVFINLTYRCNYNCYYCYERKIELPLDDMTEYELENILQTFFCMKREYNINPVFIFFGGEPLLNFDIVSKTIKKLNQVYRREVETSLFSLITNLSNLPQSFFDFTKLVPYFKIYVGVNSIDSIFQAKYCNSTIIKNLETLKQYKNVDVSIETIITDEAGINIGNLSKLYSFVLDNNYKWVVYTDFAYCKKHNDVEKLSELFYLISPCVFDKNISINNNGMRKCANCKIADICCYKIVPSEIISISKDCCEINNKLSNFWRAGKQQE
jgi:organic radical activating enzyme